MLPNKIEISTVPNEDKISNKLEKLPKHKWPKKSILDVLEEPSPDYRETLWGPDFRSFIPSPIPNQSYATDDIVKSLAANNLEAPAPQRSSFSCTFWIVVIVASVALIAAGIIVPLVVLNNARSPSKANPISKLPYEPPLFASSDGYTDGELRNLPIIQTNTIIQKKMHKESDPPQAMNENGESNVKDAVLPENSKDRKVDVKLTTENPIHKAPNSKNLKSTGLGKGLAAGLGIGLAAGIGTAAKRIYNNRKQKNKRTVVQIRSNVTESKGVNIETEDMEKIIDRKNRRIKNKRKSAVKLKDKEQSKAAEKIAHVRTKYRINNKNKSDLGELKDKEQSKAAKKNANKYFIKNQKKHVFGNLKDQVKKNKASKIAKSYVEEIVSTKSQQIVKKKCKHAAINAFANFKLREETAIMKSADGTNHVLGIGKLKARLEKITTIKKIADQNHMIKTQKKYVLEIGKLKDHVEKTVKNAEGDQKFQETVVALYDAKDRKAIPNIQDLHWSIWFIISYITFIIAGLEKIIVLVNKKQTALATFSSYFWKKMHELSKYDAYDLKPTPNTQALMYWLILLIILIRCITMGFGVVPFLIFQILFFQSIETREIVETIYEVLTINNAWVLSKLHKLINKIIIRKYH